jgi:hypothetical protein
MHVEDVAGGAECLAARLVFEAGALRVGFVRPENAVCLPIRTVDGEEDPGCPFPLAPGEALGEIPAAADGADATFFDNFVGYA